jgi:NAD+ kinase
MSQFGLIANPYIDGSFEIARKVMDILEPDHECIVNPFIAEKLGDKERGVPTENMSTDIIITIGGDGTILRTLQLSKSKILGVNAGVLGFLTEVSSDKLKHGLKRLVEGDYIVDERIKLKTMLNEKRLEDAVNEAVIHTSQIAKIHSYEVFVDELKADMIRADGIIIATPTGSTCYAMSVGGPILDPKLHGFVITPIAPFKLASRPIVVSSGSTVTVKLEDTHRKCVLVLDGQSEYEVGRGDVITLSQSEEPAKFIRFEPDFYKRVSEKLRQEY